RQPLEKLTHGLEELSWIGGGGCRRRAGRDLGEESCQLRAPDRPEPGERLAVGCETIRAQSIDPRGERQHLLRLVAPAEQDACALAAGLGDQFCDQTALADAGFAHDRDELTLARERGLQGIPELRQLDLAAHERRLDGERTGIEHTFRATARRSDAGGARRSDRPLRQSPLQYL